MYISIPGLCHKAQVHPGHSWERHRPVYKVVQLTVHFRASIRGNRTFLDALRLPSSTVEPSGFSLELSGRLNWLKGHIHREPDSSPVERGEPSRRATVSAAPPGSTGPKGTRRTFKPRETQNCDVTKKRIELSSVNAGFPVWWKPGSAHHRAIPSLQRRAAVAAAACCRAVFHASGPERTVRTEGKMNAALCWLGILDERLLQRALDPRLGRRFIFRLDSDATNTGRVSKSGSRTAL